MEGNKGTAMREDEAGAAVSAATTTTAAAAAASAATETAAPMAATDAGAAAAAPPAAAGAAAIPGHNPPDSEDDENDDGGENGAEEGEGAGADEDEDEDDDPDYDPEEEELDLAELTAEELAAMFERFTGYQVDIALLRRAREDHRDKLVSLGLLGNADFAEADYEPIGDDFGAVPLRDASEDAASGGDDVGSLLNAMSRLDISTAQVEEHISAAAASFDMASVPKADAQTIAQNKATSKKIITKTATPAEQAKWTLEEVVGFRDLLEERCREVQALAEVTLDEAQMLQDDVLFEKAAAAQLMAYRMLRAMHGGGHRKTLAYVVELSLVPRSTGRLEEALTLVQEALHTARRRLGNGDPLTTSLFVVYGQLMVQLGRGAAAVAQLETIYQAEAATSHKASPAAIAVLNAIATMHHGMGQHEQSEATHARICGLLLELDGPDHSDTLDAMMEWSTALNRIGQHARARDLQMTVYRVFDDRDDDVSAMLALHTLKRVAQTCELMGQYKEAEVLLKECLEGFEDGPQADAHTALRIHGQLARVYKNRGRFRQMVEASRRCATGLFELLGPHDPDTLTARDNHQDYLQIFKREAQLKRKTAQGAAEAVQGGAEMQQMQEGEGVEEKGGAGAMEESEGAAAGPAL